MVSKLWGKLRHASVRELAASAALALVAAVVLDRFGPRGGEAFVGMLLGLGVGLGFMGLAVWQMRRER